MACPPPVNNLNIYEMEAAELDKLGVRQLPGSLPEALHALAADAILVEALGPEAFEAFHRAKQAEWDNYRIRVMDWEVENYLETA
jgi:glutamine synthetase